ncbi:MAG: amino acid ABC transporter substrate-binding protein [Candidatus Korarchaeota archaeon]|nr:amino acid ABC transporter substrate-binding protein [Candidatus Korarchaeota archaeon]
MASKALSAVGLIIVAIIAFVVGYFVYPAVNPAGAAGGVSWEDIKSKGVLVVATSPDWPPFEFIDPKTNKIVGYEVDLMNAVAQKLGLRVEWKAMDFDTIIQAVKNKEVDMGVSGFSVTPERLEQVLFTMPHTVTEVQLIMTEKRAKELGITRLASIEDVAKYNLIIGTGSGTLQEAELLDLVKKGILKSDQVKSYPDFEVALEDMKKGTIDAVYAETPVTTWWISTEEVPLTVIYSRSYWPVAFMANKDYLELVKKIDGALAELFASGEVDKIRAKWNVTSG